MLKKAAATAVQWNTASTAIVFAVQIIQLAVLARLLLPGDFGLAATVTIILGFVQSYVDMGIGNAIIHRQDIKANELHSLYWFNVFAGALAFALLAAATPLIIKFYHEPRLGPLLICAALIPLIASWGQQFQALLQKELQFRTLALVDAASALVGFVVSMLSVAAGFGALSLVTSQLGAACCTALSLVAIGWRRRPPALHFSTSDLRGYLSFGLYQVGARTISLVTARLDQFFISIFLGPIALGYYSIGWNLTIQPLYRINAVLTRVSFPVFARIQHDTQRLKRGYMFVIWMLSTVNAPIMLGLAVVAPALVPLALGERWELAIPTIQILSIVGWLRTMGNPIGSLLLAMGRADLDFKWDFAFMLVQVPALYFSARYLPLEGVAGVVALLMAANLAAMYLLLRRWLFGPCLWEYVRNICAPFALAAIMAGAVFAVGKSFPTHSVVNLSLQVVIGAVVYVILSFVTQRLEWRELIKSVRRSS
ncbi:MAG TPA: MOP flippase family protein [Bradyrhizobium sp.]|nr:MOP flippase family protein [Bradyrhizobium sp.]